MPGLNDGFPGLSAGVGLSRNNAGLWSGMAGLQGGAANPFSVFGSSLAVYHDLQGSTPLYKDFVGTPAAVGDGVALAFDSASWGGRSLSQMVAAQSELRGNGAIGMVGTATAATYNTSTGAGSVSRVDLSNQSYVRWVGLNSQGWYIITVTNTGAAQLCIRNTPGGSIAATLNAGETKSFYVSPNVAILGEFYICAISNSTTVTFTVTSFKLIPGAHMYQSSAGSQPKLRQNATTGAYYLECDGSDDGMVTPSLDLSATDKVAVFTACRKLSDAARGTIVELTASAAANNGSFHMTAPNAASATFGFESKGTTLTDAVATSQTAPKTAVLTGIGNIAGDSTILRVNGAQADQDTGDQGTGNYSNAALYYFRRGGSSLPFNGYYYGDMIFAGTPTPAQIAWAEAYYNRLSGAY